jgi:type I restriction enzyme S subunit
MPKQSIWSEVPIKDVYLGLFDGPHATPKPSESGPVFLGIKNVTEDGALDFTDVRHIAEDDFISWTRRVEPKAGDLVFTYEATLNRYAIIPPNFRGCLGRRMALIRINPEKVDVKYLLYYFFTSEWREVIKRNILTGSTVDRIPLTSFPNFPVRLPPLPIQRSIANILSAYDDLIENNQRRIAILEQMARGLYREWFVHYRYPGHEDVPLVDSPLGPIPQGWEVRKLKDGCRLTMGQSPKSEYYNEVGNGIAFHQGVSDFGQRFPSDRLFCTAEGRIAEVGDILFSVRAPVGRMNIANKRIILGRGLSAIRHNQDQQAFLWEQLRNRFTEVDLIGNGSIFASVTKEDMQNIELIWPAQSVVDEATTIFNPLHSQIANLSITVQNLRRTRDLLLPRLLSGQLDVGAVE